jgi:hypothetical protein
MTTTMPDRIVGALLSDTPLFWKEDDQYLDLAAYTFTVVATAIDTPATVLFTKSSGITGATGTSAVPNVMIVWTTGDLGLLTAGRYRLRVSAITGAKPRIHDLQLTVNA